MEKFNGGRFNIIKNRCLNCGREILRSKDFCSRVCENVFFGDGN